jgi:hypothetical protein
MNEIASAIVALNERLKKASFDYAFLGGSVLSLLVNDAMADEIRVTKDVDVIAGIRTRRDFHRGERELEACGFRHDMSEDAPVCRWVSEGIVVDILPVREEVLGWKSRWFDEALRSAKVVNVEGHEVNVVSAPFFVALKLEAFEDRGKGDFITSTDFEDIICLFNGRRSLVEEILSEEMVREGICSRFARYVLDSNLEDAVLGFVQTEPNPEMRFESIMNAMRRLAASGE